MPKSDPDPGVLAIGFLATPYVIRLTKEPFKRSLVATDYLDFFETQGLILC